MSRTDRTQRREREEPIAERARKDDDDSLAVSLN